MKKLGTVAFKGADGHKHEFTIYPIDVKLKEGQGGIYFLTARTDEPHSHHSHHKVYVGETDDLSTALLNHPKQSAFDSEGANCICIHLSQDPQARKRITEELIEKYAPPCND